MKIKVGNWIVDEQSQKLINDQQEVSLSSTAFKLLQLFISRPNDIITHNDIKQQVWGSIHTTDNLLYQTIRILRKSLEKDAQTDNAIKTVPRKGYQLLMPIEVLTNKPAATVAVDDSVITLSNQGRHTKSIWLVSNCLMIVAAILWMYFYHFVGAKVNHPNQLVWIDHEKFDSSEHLKQFFTTQLPVMADKMGLEIQKLDYFTDISSSPDLIGSGNKLMLLPTPIDNQLLLMSFVGEPMGLAYIANVQLNTAGQIVESSVFEQAVAVESMPAVEDGQIIDQLYKNKYFRALAALSFAENASAEHGLDLLVGEIDQQAMSNKTKIAQKYFVGLIGHYYQIRRLSQNELLEGLNFLLTEFAHSRDTQLAVAIYMSDIGLTRQAIALIKDLEVAPFDNFVKGLFQLELDEGLKAVNEFSQVYQLAPQFEDNSLFYLIELKDRQKQQAILSFDQDFQNNSYLSSEIIYQLYQWRIEQGDLVDGLAFLSSHLDSLVCDRDFYGTMARLTTILSLEQEGQFWTVALQHIDHRDWRFPLLAYTSALFNGQLSDYELWYASFTHDVLGGDSSAEAAILEVVVKIAMQKMIEAQQALDKITLASTFFTSVEFIELFKIVMQNQIDNFNAQTRVKLPVEAKRYLDSINFDELAFPHQLLASYHLASKHYGLAEQQLLAGCSKNPAICIGWSHLPNFNPITETNIYQQTKIKARNLIMQQTPVVQQIHQRALQLCELDDSRGFLNKNS